MFRWVVKPQAQRCTRPVYDYRAMMEHDQSTVSIKLHFDANDTHENAAMGAWVLLEAGKYNSSDGEWSEDRDEDPPAMQA